MLDGLRKALNAALELATVMISEQIDSLGQDSRSDLRTQLAELRGRNNRLEQEIDSLRFNGPTLYRDEVDALLAMIDWSDCMVEAEPHIGALKSILRRCDHMPMTQAELAARIDGIIDGSVQTVPWIVGARDDVGKDVDAKDEYEGSWREAADNEGARIAAGKDSDE